MLPDRSALSDALVTFWVVFWLAVGAWTGVEMWRLAALGDSLANTGRGLGQVGSALESLGGVPVLGGVPDELGDEVRSTAVEVVRNGQLAERGLRRLAVLLGLSIALLPATPVLLSYLPDRLRRRRPAQVGLPPHVPG